MATQAALLDASTDGVSDPGIALMPDAVLVRRLIEGSEEALAALYDRHINAVFAAALRTSRDRWIAAEVVQETFLALWNRAELFDPSRGALSAWLARIARNRAVDHLRAAGRHDQAAAFSSFGRTGVDDHSVVEWLTESGVLIAAAGPAAAPEVALADKEMRASIQEAVVSLEPLERRVIVLAYGEGLSQSEIADRLGWPIGTVKTRTRRALRHLRDRMEQAPGTVPSPEAISPAVKATPQLCCSAP